MLLIYQKFGILLCISICLFGFSSCRRDREKKEKICTKTVWELRNASVTLNNTGVLKRGDGYWSIVHVENLHNGKVNVTSSIEICCDGYEKNEAGKCKKCVKGWFGTNCSEKCECERKQRCNHITGCVDKCEKKGTCVDESTHQTTESVITEVNNSSINKTPTAQLTTITPDVFTKENINYCLICKAANNCTPEYNCTSLTAGIGSKDTRKTKDKNTILIAVIVSLVVLTLALVACVVTRERYHKAKKRKNTHLPSVRELNHFADDCNAYVDPEPVYFEIKDEDITVGNGNIYHKQTSVCSDTPKDDAESVQFEYLNPYTPLRFARSETNLFKDRKIKENGEYNVVYSIAKSIPKDENSNKDISSQDRMSDSGVSSSQTEVKSSNEPVYFVLEKTQPSVESHVPEEREKLLKRSSRSSI